jgi:hypothetical protein
VPRIAATPIAGHSGLPCTLPLHLAPAICLDQKGPVEGMSGSSTGMPENFAA